MKKASTARELEFEAAASKPREPKKALLPCGGVMLMLARRGLHPRESRLGLPFLENLEEDKAARLSQLLDHYGFRLFLRGAILHPEGFAPEGTSKYVEPARSMAYAESVVELGLAERTSKGCYRLRGAAKNFGGILEWYVSRELVRRFGFDVATGVKLHARGVGGDLDVVATAEGKLAYLELKSSPPKHLDVGEIVAFFDRMSVLRPDVTLFVLDTALRLSDKVLPMLMTELEHRRGGAAFTPRRVVRELWALTPHLYAVNAKLDLMANIGRALGEGLLALSPTL